ncbi:MAG: type II secretion system protein [Candidatus Paceibacterota bacterium]
MSPQSSKYLLKKGMTLAEMLVVIAVIGIVMVAVFAFEANIFIYTNQSQTQITNTWQAEAVLKPMTKELRSMIPSASGSYAIFSAATSSITFFNNVNNDTAIEKVRYFLSSTTLYRGQIIPTGNPPVYNPANETLKILATGVRASSTLPVFRYFDSSYQGTSSPLSYPLSISSVRLINVTIIIDSDPNRSPIPRTFSSSVSLRNLKNNL